MSSEKSPELFQDTIVEIKERRRQDVLKPKIQAKVVSPEIDSGALKDNEDSEVQSNLDCKGLQINKFRPKVFLEFSLYFLLAQWLGPVSFYLVFIWKKNGRILAKNLHIYGGWKEIFRSIVWVIRIYCFVLTYALEDYESQSQFWLVIYTDISLAVLYGAYYSSFTETEIKLFRTTEYDPGTDIVKKLVALVKNERTKAFEKRIIVSRFPQIDINNFYFVYPRRYEHAIPSELEPNHISESEAFVKKTLLTDGFIVKGEKFATYMTDKIGYKSMDKKVLGIRIFSRVLILVRVLLPVGANILDNFKRLDEVPNTLTLVLYIIQQFCYCYFIYLFAQIYDVLFLGLLLYFKKFMLLRKLKETIEVRPTASFKELLKIVPAVPINIENWLNLRRVMAQMNNQAFVVIDTNMSFALFYSIIFIAIYALYTVGLLVDLLDPIGQFLVDNPVLQTTLFFTLLIIVVVVGIHLVLGILINGLFPAEKKEWNVQLSIVRSLEQNQISYCYWIEEEKKTISDFEEGDEYMERIDDLKSTSGNDFTKNLPELTRKLKKAISIVIDGIDFEEAYNAHKLLGMKTTPQLFSLIITFVSAVGLSAINDVLSKGISG